MDALTLKNLFLFHLREIYNGEKQLVEALPGMVKSVSNKNLQMILRENIELTKVHLSRIEQIFDRFAENPMGENCNIMEGLLEEVDEVEEENESPDLIDLNIIGMCQKINHFLIAGYGTVQTFAKVLQEDNLSELIRLSREDEFEMDVKLNKLASEIVQIYARVIFMA